MKKLLSLFLTLLILMSFAVTAFGLEYSIETEKKNKEVVAVVFGFNGEQTILSNFTVTVDLGINWFELRELFGKKLEEEDIITYYLIKDGKVIKEYEVDYMTASCYENIVLEIEAENGTLGKYKFVTELSTAKPAEAPTENAPYGEVNPNTGAPALWLFAVLAGATAVLCKK